MVSKLTFVGFMRGDRSNRSSWIRTWFSSAVLCLLCRFSCIESTDTTTAYRIIDNQKKLFFSVLFP